MRPDRSPRARIARTRSGFALLAALALLALASALLAGGFASASASARATRSARASVVARSTARRALARAIIAWSRTEDVMAVGGTVASIPPESAAVSPDSADTRVVVQRLSASLYLVAADVSVPRSGPSLARRRLRLLVERQQAADSTTVLPPRALSRWALGDLY